MIFFRIIATVLLFTNVVITSQTIIDGLAPKHKKKFATLNKIVNYSNFRLELIEKTTIDSIGNFQFSVNCENAFLAVIEIDNEYGYLYMDPSTSSYNLLFMNNDEIINPLRKKNVQLTFNDLSKNDLNTLILDFNLRLDYFLYGDTAKIVRLAQRTQEFSDSLDQFKSKLITYYGDIKKQYLHNYIRYSIGSIEQMTNSRDIEKNRFETFNFYLKDMPVLYENNAYMTFFNQFYDNTLSLPESGSDEKVRFAINNYTSLDKLHEALSTDYFLRDKRIRELAIINGLSQIYYKNSYDPNSILSILREIQHTSDYKEHKKLSANLISTLTHLNRGTTAPNFVLTNQFDENIKLNELKGKYIYISFFSSESSTSILHMDVIKSLYEKYSDNITFISISLDKDKDNYINFCNEFKDYKWNICHYDFDHNIVRDYQLKNIPSYILLDKEGNIDQAPAYSPIADGNSVSIEKTFFTIKKNNSSKKEFKIGGKN